MEDIIESLTNSKDLEYELCYLHNEGISEISIRATIIDYKVLRGFDMIEFLLKEKTHLCTQDVKLENIICRTSDMKGANFVTLRKGDETVTLVYI